MNKNKFSFLDNTFGPFSKIIIIKYRQNIIIILIGIFN